MKVSAFVLGAVAQVASAHYFFDATVVNGVASSSFKYIRDFTRPTKYNPIKFSSNPAVDIRDNSFVDGPDIRCNQGAFSKAGSTEVLTVNAGSAVTVKLGVGATMQHPGPALVYLSRAPNDNVKTYDGSGDWFKIYQEGVCNQGGDFTKDAWCTYNKNVITATIPKNTPAESTSSAPSTLPEHYVSCVQIKVVGGGSGTPGPTVKFPGAYKDSDAYAKFSIYGGYKSFPFPGPTVWDGASGSSSSNAASANASAAAPAATPVNTPASSPAKTPAAAAGSECSSFYGQCGGKGFSGPKCCSRGTCKEINEYYSQCA
ncbi:carbohydrate-binding module family 1 protein [Colletotrichum tofieldiae]|nr:carbohydrate-binding module family 1 protein [Colletotrichum tofieldiae]